MNDIFYVYIKLMNYFIKSDIAKNSFQNSGITLAKLIF